MEKIKVLLVDDHLVVRQGLRALLAGLPEIEVVGEAADGGDALRKVKETAPDVVLTDIRMPHMDGIEATRRIKAERPETVIIVLTAYENDAYLVDAIHAGAGGYLLKDASLDLILHTICAAVGGGTMVGTSLLRQVVASMKSDGKNRGEPENPLFELTRRELDVLKLLSDGGTNRQIAIGLGISEDTTKKHVQNIIAKLGAADRTHAATIAARAGLLGRSATPQDAKGDRLG
ncbi:MAG: response regulator transcription factor [Chloroflexi bacterium]|nr:response regulator transcription factor [Chloroflexota bacterium]